MNFERRDVDFESEGTRCAAWLYEPAVENPPVILMSHGFGGEREARLPEFAEEFAEAGYAALVFDFRGFGDSDGDPPHIVSGPRHVTDYLAAIEHVRSIDAVDGDRIALWGTSFSGGHVIEAAARDGDIEAVVAQVPFTDGLRNAVHLVRRGGISYLASATVNLVRDTLRAVTFRDPHYVPIVADPDEFGVLNTHDSKSGYYSLIPDGREDEFENECAGRILGTVGLYRPVTAASDVDCPVFVGEATEDSIIPSGSVEALVERLDEVEHEAYPIGHFGPYKGEWFEDVVADERDFFDRHLD